GMGSFNHAIVVVPGEPAIWIDPTDRYARAGELPAGDQGRLALIASPAADGLVRTPEARAADNREVETREIFLADLGSARIVETSEIRGVAERELRASYAGQDSKAVRESLADYVSAVYLTEKIGKIDHSDPADLSSPFQLRIEAEESPRGFTDLPNASVALFPASTLSRLPAELQNEGDETKPRKAEYALTRPHISEIRYRIVPPAGFRPQALPSARVRQLGPGTLSEEYAADENGTVTATLRFEIDKRRLSAEEFEALRKGAVEVNEEDAVLLHFDQVGEAHIAAGRIREALDELRPLAAASPKKALPRLHIARALLAGGMGESAREEAKRAADLEPSFAAAWRELAWVLVHDPVGRLFGEGFDRAGALAAYRKAKELDPKDMLARRNLAILLEHDEKGRRYSADADLAAAIDEYRAFKADLDNGELDDNLAIDLLRTGRFQELKDLLDDLEATDLRKSLRLVALAALQGAGTAVKEAERSFPNVEERRQALEGAAGNLAIVRRYAEAADLLESASRRAPNAAEILMRAEMMRKTRRYDELNFSSAEPAGVAKRLLVLPAAGSLDPQVLFASFSRGVREEIGDEEKALDDFEEALASVAGMVDDGEAPVDMVLDLALSAVRETVAGNEALGYRVTLSLAFADEQMVYYVVREDGEYKLAGFYKAVFLLGREALLRLERGDLAGARQWLDWAREEWTASGGDDPLGSSPFTTLWTRGAEGTADEARCAAASLLAGSRKSETIVPVLLSCRDSAAEGPRRTAVDLSLALAYQSTKRYAEMADVAQRLSASAPGSQRAFVLLKSALARLERWDDVRRLAEQRLAAMPDDPDALQVLYETAEERGDLEEAEKHLQRIVDSGKATATGFNNLAWLALFRNKAGDQAVELAQRAAMLDEYGSPFSLHTLASLYAEMGKTAEAYRVILQALEASGPGGPDADDWYVFGRLAEHYGLPDAARSYYARVAPPEPGRLSYISTWRLAQQRLAVLGPEAKEAKRPRRR
ncbi:MAG TPA: hypothetical protein VFR31_06430, partial [Thermoanaerobaculia bacterium]|nr:hypothetical protein [Thermoanaerobaculia bacterium]